MEIDILVRPSPEQLWRDYQSKRRPVLIRGLADDWAVSRWTPQRLRERLPGLMIRYETWEGDEHLDDPVEFFKVHQRSHTASLAEFIDMMERAAEPTRKFYCAGFPIFDEVPQLRRDLGPLDRYMGLPSWLPAPARARLQVTPYLWLGPAGCLSPLHFDRSENFFMMVHGRKQWIMVPPEDSAAVYFPSPQLSSSVVHFSPVDAEHPDLARFPRFAEARKFHVTVEQGDVLYTPAGWWHHVRALTHSIALNFFWHRPVHNTVVLRHYLVELARRRARGALGLAA
jgi:[protein]-arginine 3-hydroxylase / protease